MKQNYILRPTRIHVLPEGEPLFSEKATIVEIVDDNTGGAFISLTQHSNDQCVAIINDEDEWNAISAAVADMFSEIRKWDKGGKEG